MRKDYSKRYYTSRDGYLHTAFDSKSSEGQKAIICMPDNTVDSFEMILNYCGSNELKLSICRFVPVTAKSTIDIPNQPSYARGDESIWTLSVFKTFEANEIFEMDLEEEFLVA